MMSSTRGFAGIVLLLSGAVACLAQQSSCLSYDPSVVKLTGTLTRKTFQGPPNYESVRKGDRPETYWFLDLSQPHCVDADAIQPDLNPAQKGIRRIQLVFLDQSSYKTYSKLLGKRVVATGTLFGEHTGHHHTPVLLTVKTLAAAEQGSITR